MLHLNSSLLLLTQPSSVLTRFSRIDNAFKKGRLLSFRAVEREESSSSSEFQVDSDKAREALDKLDKQLLSLSNKQPPPSRAQYLDRQQPQAREEAPDFSGPFLPYSAFVLLLFSILYNVIFITVIKPAIDFPEQMEATSVGESSTSKPKLPLAPPTTDSSKL